MKEIACALEPYEAACALAPRGGVSFLDSSLPGGQTGRISMVAADPVAEIAGRDWGELDRAVADLRRGGAGPDHGLPDSAAIGAVTYEGDFRFLVYDHVYLYDHARSVWLGKHEFPHARDSREFTARNAAGQYIDFQSLASSDDYLDKVARLQEYIAAGDIYQANLAQAFEAPWEGDALAFHEFLRACSPAPYAAYLDQGARHIISASPELFLKFSGRRVRTCPIKGTRPRRRDAQQDERSAYDLITSEKERAELVMITDLERNDLGRICEYGSVEVRELLEMKRFEQVFHLVSTVEGTLRSNVSQVGALQACFPGGSITGAPKKRAMEIISELEGHPRGVYTGTLGYFGGNGESQFNIAIRTAVQEHGKLTFHVGAGIVADSVPEMEYRETLDKAQGVLQAAEQWNRSAAPVKSVDRAG